MNCNFKHDKEKFNEYMKDKLSHIISPQIHGYNDDFKKLHYLVRLIISNNFSPLEFFDYLISDDTTTHFKSLNIFDSLTLEEMFKENHTVIQHSSKDYLKSLNIINKLHIILMLVNNDLISIKPLNIDIFSQSKNFELIEKISDFYKTYFIDKNFKDFSENIGEGFETTGKERCKYEKYFECVKSKWDNYMKNYYHNFKSYFQEEEKERKRMEEEKRIEEERKIIEEREKEESKKKWKEEKKKEEEKLKKAVEDKIKSKGILGRLNTKYKL
jgi:hypothetical protein